MRNHAVPAAHAAEPCLSAVRRDGLCAWIAWRPGPPFRVLASGVEWAKDGPRPGHHRRHPEADALAAALHEVLGGAPAPLPVRHLDLAMLTPFARRVLATLRETTPAGQVTTYGALAAACGRPRAARAVGNILRRNPFPLFYPCHRVIAAGGQAGGFQGGPAGTPLKIRLLAIEASKASPGRAGS